MNDLYQNKVGQAIAENSAFTLLLGQKPEAINVIQENKRLPLGEGGYRILKTVHSSKGHYSEIFMITPRGIGIARLTVDPYSLLLYSTAPEDVQAVRNYTLAGMPQRQAILQVLEDRGSRCRPPRRSPDEAAQPLLHSGQNRPGHGRGRASASATSDRRQHRLPRQGRPVLGAGRRRRGRPGQPLLGGHRRAGEPVPAAVPRLDHRQVRNRTGPRRYFRLQIPGLDPLFEDGTTLVKVLDGLPGDQVAVTEESTRVNGQVIATGLQVARQYGFDPQRYVRQG
ncbi:hypothetical protein ACFSHR_01255 [Azotobacter chroococcum]